MVYKRRKADGTEYPHWYVRVKWKGRDYRWDTRQGNKTVAKTLENDFRVKLAKGEAGLPTGERIPTLAEFEKRFVDHVQAHSKGSTAEFYGGYYKGLLAFTPLSQARLDRIDEALIERFVQEKRKTVSPATVNRALATLRKALRLAVAWKVIKATPKFRMLPGERRREYVLPLDQEQKYLDACPQPLKDVALLILDTGLRVGEAVGLSFDDVHLKPSGGAKFGYVQIREGKSKNARRTVIVTNRVAKMLTERPMLNRWVFPGDRKDCHIVTTSLDHMHQEVRELLKLPDEFVLHSLRHTFLTRLGLAGVDAFTLMKIAGHSSITISQRYVHPTPEAMVSAFEKLEQLRKKPRKKRGSSGAQAPDVAA